MTVGDDMDKGTVLLKNIPTFSEEDLKSTFPIIDFFKKLQDEGKAKIQQESYDKYLLNTRLEVLVDTTCPNCKKQSTLSLNGSKNVFFCLTCKKGGGSLKTVSFFTNRTMKEVMRDVALDKAHPLLRLTNKQIGVLGYSALDIEKLERKSDYATMDEIYREYRMYEKMQLSFVYGLFLLAIACKSKDDTTRKLDMLYQYIQKMAIRTDAITLCLKEYSKRMNIELYNKELQSTNHLYLSIQKELMEEQNDFISYESVVAYVNFGEFHIPSNEDWAKQGTMYARKAFEMYKQQNQRFKEAEQFIFELAEYKLIEKVMGKKKPVEIY